jgi:hypothetical protein
MLIPWGFLPAIVNVRLSAELEFDLLSGVTRYYPDHNINVSKHNTQARLGLSVDQQRSTWARRKTAS